MDNGCKALKNQEKFYTGGVGKEGCVFLGFPQGFCWLLFPQAVGKGICGKGGKLVFLLQRSVESEENDRCGLSHNARAENLTTCVDVSSENEIMHLNWCFIKTA